MRRSRDKKPERLLGDPNDPDGLGVWSRRYLEAMRVRAFSELTLQNRAVYLAQFIDWCAARSLGRPHEITRPILERFQRFLFHYRQRNGRPLSLWSQNSRLSTLKALFRWLVRQGVLVSNPASELEPPRIGFRLPQDVLTLAEAERVLGGPDLGDPLGLRDRALLELLYSTGIRRSELSRLGLYDVDVTVGTLRVREGKWRNDRVVPLGERAGHWVERYAHEVRPLLAVPPDEGFLFLTNQGDSLTPGYLTQMVRGYVEQAELGKRGGCHLFRHTMATLMLEGGADVRFVQEMLGHQSLETTQIYTRVSIRKLREVHAATHPGARLARTKPEADAGGSGSGSAGGGGGEDAA